VEINSISQIPSRKQICEHVGLNKKHRLPEKNAEGERKHAPCGFKSELENGLGEDCVTCHKLFSSEKETLKITLKTQKRAYKKGTHNLHTHILWTYETRLL